MGQIFKHMNLWRPYLFKTPQKGKVPSTMSSPLPTALSLWVSQRCRDWPMPNMTQLLFPHSLQKSHHQIDLEIYWGVLGGSTKGCFQVRIGGRGGARELDPGPLNYWMSSKESHSKQHPWANRAPHNGSVGARDPIWGTIITRWRDSPDMDATGATEHHLWFQHPHQPVSSAPGDPMQFSGTWTHIHYNKQAHRTILV